MRRHHCHNGNPYTSHRGSTWKFRSKSTASRTSTTSSRARCCVHYVREVVGLTGTNIGCDTSSCGACTLHVNGEAVKSCTMLAVQADGQSIKTIEGLANGDQMHPMQTAFMECHALQCGYCTPGMVMASVSLLDEIPNPTEAQVREGLEGNLCVVRAITTSSRPS